MAIEIEVSGDLVVISTGKDRICALKSSLRISAKRIGSVEVLPRREVPPGRGVRLPGTYIPGVVHHGSYGFGANRESWAVFRPDEVLVVTVDGWEYRRIVLGTENPASDAMRLSRFV